MVVGFDNTDGGNVSITDTGGATSGMSKKAWLILVGIVLFFLAMAGGGR